MQSPFNNEQHLPFRKLTPQERRHVWGLLLAGKCQRFDDETGWRTLPSDALLYADAVYREVPKAGDTLTK